MKDTMWQTYEKHLMNYSSLWRGCCKYTYMKLMRVLESESGIYIMHDAMANTWVTTTMLKKSTAHDASYFVTFNMRSIHQLMYGTIISLQANLILIFFGKSKTRQKKKTQNKNIETPFKMWLLLTVTAPWTTVEHCHNDLSGWFYCWFTLVQFGEYMGNTDSHYWVALIPSLNSFLNCSDLNQLA